MSLLAKARAEIDAIDQEMLALFLRRMHAVKEVLQYKQLHQLPVLDFKRETELKQQKLGLLESNEFKLYYELFLDAVLKASRTYQEDHYE